MVRRYFYMPKTVAVFFGGNSNEHEISVITGMLAVNLLRAANYRVIPVFLPRTGGMMSSEKMRSVSDFRTPCPQFPYIRLTQGGIIAERGHKKPTHIDAALNCCHGGMGEDGTLSALLAWHNIPSASPDVPISAVFMNKRLTKLAARGMQLPVLPSIAVREGEWRAEKGKTLSKIGELGYPVVVKPCRLGSSIGVTVASSPEELEAALALAFRLDDDALIETYLEGKRDVNCAAFRRGETYEFSPLEEVFSEKDILTFGEKYEGEQRRASQIPADLPAPVAEKIYKIMQTLCENFAFRGVVRGDFLVAGEEIYFNELNTVPGSLACYLFGKTLTESRNFLVSLVEEAAAPRPKEVLISGILNENIFARGKGCKRR